MEGGGSNSLDRITVREVWSMERIRSCAGDAMDHTHDRGVVNVDRYTYQQYSHFNDTVLMNRQLLQSRTSETTRFYILVTMMMAVRSW